MQNVFYDMAGRYLLPTDGVTLASLGAPPYSPPGEDWDGEDPVSFGPELSDPAGSIGAAPWAAPETAAPGAGISFADMVRTISPEADADVWREENSAPFWILDDTRAQSSPRFDDYVRTIDPRNDPDIWRVDDTAPRYAAWDDPAGYSVPHWTFARTISPTADAAAWNEDDAASHWLPEAASPYGDATLEAGRSGAAIAGRASLPRFLDDAARGRADGLASGDDTPSRVQVAGRKIRPIRPYQLEVVEPEGRSWGGSGAAGRFGPIGIGRANPVPKVQPKTPTGNQPAPAATAQPASPPAAGPQVRSVPGALAPAAPPATGSTPREPEGKPPSEGFRHWRPEDTLATIWRRTGVPGGRLPEGAPASAFVGRTGAGTPPEKEVFGTPLISHGYPSRNPPGLLRPSEGRQPIPSTGHGMDKVQDQGFVPSVIDHVLRTGKDGPGWDPGTVMYYDHINHIIAVFNEKGELISAYRTSRKK